jgi:hypothetical protein
MAPGCASRLCARKNDRCGAGDPITFFCQNHRNPYSWQFNFGVQHELRSNLPVETVYISIFRTAY